MFNVWLLILCVCVCVCVCVHVCVCACVCVCVCVCTIIRAIRAKQQKHPTRKQEGTYIDNNKNTHLIMSSGESKAGAYLYYWLCDQFQCAFTFCCSGALP